MDKEHKHNFCFEKTQIKLPPIISLYLVMGCMPKKIQHVLGESFHCRSASRERLCGSPVVAIATLPREGW